MRAYMWLELGLSHSTAQARARLMLRFRPMPTASLAASTEKPLRGALNSAACCERASGGSAPYTRQQRCPPASSTVRLILCTCKLTCGHSLRVDCFCMQDVLRGPGSLWTRHVHTGVLVMRAAAP